MCVCIAIWDISTSISTPPIVKLLLKAGLDEVVASFRRSDAVSLPYQSSFASTSADDSRQNWKKKDVTHNDSNNSSADQEGGDVGIRRASEAPQEASAGEESPVDVMSEDEDQDEDQGEGEGEDSRDDDEWEPTPLGSGSDTSQHSPTRGKTSRNPSRHSPPSTIGRAGSPAPISDIPRLESLSSIATPEEIKARLTLTVEDVHNYQYNPKVFISELYHRISSDKRRAVAMILKYMFLGRCHSSTTLNISIDDEVMTRCGMQQCIRCLK